MSSKETVHNFKIVAVGDGAVGKTCLLVCYAENKFPVEYVPTIFENYHSNTKFKDNFVRLSIYDTAGQEDFNDLRNLCYPGTDVFLVCFSLVVPTSLRNVKDFWIKDIRENGPKDAIVILVGTMEDLREDSTALRDLKLENKSPVSREEAIEFAKQIGAKTYFETSAKMMRGVKELFTKSVEYCFLKEKGSGKKKRIGLSGGDEKSGLFGSSERKDDAEEDLNDFAKKWGN